MKLCAGFVLALLVIKMANCENVKLVARAISGIIEEVFVKKSERIEIVSVAFGRQSNMDVLDEILRVQQEIYSQPIEVRHIDLTQTWDRHLNKSAIFFLESPKAFYVINAAMKLGNKLPKTFKFLLHNEELGEELIELFSAQKLNLTLTFQKLSFLRSRNGSVELNAITFYAPGACRIWSSVIINKFSESLKKWETKDKFFITTIDQFYGCKLKVYLGTAKQHMRKLPNGTEVLTGQPHAILSTLSKQLNFTYRFTSSTDDDDDDEDFDLFYEINSNVHSKKALKIDLHVTTTFMSSEYIIVTTLCEFYTPLEKLFLPFDKETWIGIGFVVVGTLILIFAVEHVPLNWRNFMFGRRVRTPVLNLWIGIVGGAQVIQPRRSWARIALAAYMLMYFVMLNHYQNKMFDFMVGDKRKPPPKSLEELIARDYTLYVELTDKFMIQDLDPSKRPRIVILMDEVKSKFTKDIKDPSVKKAALVTARSFSRYRVERSRESVDWQRIEGNILVVQFGLMMGPNAYLFDTFDQGIKKLLPTGLIAEGNIEFDPPNRKQPAKEASEKALSMKELAIAFKILMLGHSIAFVVFVLEKIKFHCFDRKREMKEKRNPKMKRKNAVRRKIAETAVVVYDETKIKETEIVEEDLDDLVMQTINEFDANFARYGKHSVPEKTKD